MTSTSTNRRPLLLGHRGARRASPENTLPAFALALAHGCDGFEFDLRRTADGRCLVCHDPKIGGIDLARATYDHVRRRFASACCFEDVLESFAGRAWLDIEVKVPGMDEVVLNGLAQHPPQRGFVVSSFLPDVLESFRARDPKLPLGLICDNRRELERWRLLPISFLMPHRTLLTGELVEQVHHSGKQVFVWTVNKEKEMLRFAGWGVDGIISDDTQLLARVLRPG